MKRPEGFDRVSGPAAEPPKRRPAPLRWPGGADLPRRRSSDAPGDDDRPDAEVQGDRSEGTGTGTGAGTDRPAVPVLRIPAAPGATAVHVSTPGGSVFEVPASESSASETPGRGAPPLETSPRQRSRAVESHSWGSVPWTPAMRVDDRRPGGTDLVDPAEHDDDAADSRDSADRDRSTGAYPSSRDVEGGSSRGDRSRDETSPGDGDDLSHRALARDLRRAARARRRYERGEIKQYTRRHRQRRIAAGVAAGLIVALVALVAVAVYSPLLALQTIRVEGTDRVPVDDVLDAVDGQLDTPLALLDLDLIEQQLGDFPLIRSYVTETIPPHTLVIHVTERQAIGVLPVGAGVVMVDPAGIVVERGSTRPDGMPLIDVGAAGAEGEAFDVAVAVLLSLPSTVLAQVDSITATTSDDVRLRLVDQGAEIRWGSSDESAYKARVLEKALMLDLTGVSEINVSAPGQLTLN